MLQLQIEILTIIHFFRNRFLIRSIIKHRKICICRTKGKCRVGFATDRNGMIRTKLQHENKSRLNKQYRYNFLFDHTVLHQHGYKVSRTPKNWVFEVMAGSRSRATKNTSLCPEK